MTLRVLWRGEMVTALTLADLAGELEGRGCKLTDEVWVIQGSATLAKIKETAGRNVRVTGRIDRGAATVTRE